MNILPATKAFLHFGVAISMLNVPLTYTILTASQGSHALCGASGASRGAHQAL